MSKSDPGLSRRDLIQIASVADDYRGEFVRMIAEAVPATPSPARA